MLWSLGVGYVISGMYFGWNLGLPEGGPFGMLAATLLVTVMYATFVMSYAELSCLMPRAGGAFVYAHQALGPELGFLTGVAQCVEFVFAPPAIAAAIGAYFNIFFPQVPPLAIAMAAYALFTALNIHGIRHSAIFEVVVTVLAVTELLIFSGMTAPHFSWAAFSGNPLPHGWWGILPAIPYAIWFYLGIEGLANTAEETKNPQRDLARGFGFSLVTLVVLALLTFFTATGVKGWEAIVFAAGSNKASDSPLPLALAQIVGQNDFFYHLLITIGLFGLLASFHGIILVAGRATFEFGRVGYAPAILGKVHPTRKTPAAALILNMLIGFAALLTGHTGEIITISVLGALTMYILSLLSLFRLRRNAPKMNRPFRTPFYPWTPAIALTLATVCLFSMAYTNKVLFLIYLALIAGGYGWYFLAIPKSIRKGLRETAEVT
jgi:ethanolamine permease